MSDPLLEPTGIEPTPESATEPTEPRAGYLTSSRRVVNSLILSTPLFIGYQIGVLFTEGWKNGVDFVTPRLYALVGNSKWLYLLANLVILAGLLLSARWVKQRYRLSRSTWGLVLLESALYATVLGSVIIWMMDLVGIDPRLSLSAADNFVLSLGAGAYEELVFRLLLMTGLIALAGRLKLKRVTGLAMAVLVSSLLFSAVHHPPLGMDPWAAGVFVYRFLAGVLFAALFLTRGFAVAAYTHAFYDVRVLVLG